MGVLTSPEPAQAGSGPNEIQQKQGEVAEGMSVEHANISNTFMALCRSNPQLNPQLGSYRCIWFTVSQWAKGVVAGFGTATWMKRG